MLCGHFMPHGGSGGGGEEITRLQTIWRPYDNNATKHSKLLNALDTESQALDSLSRILYLCL